MVAGQLELVMFANVARLSNDMASAKRTVTSAVSTMEKALGALGVGFSAAALLSKIDSVTEGMAKLQDTSEKTGTSVENLSKLQFFAGVSGSSLDGVANALAKLSKNMASTGNEGAAATQALKFLDLSAKDTFGNLKDPAELLGEISQKLAGYQDGAGKAAIAISLFGKAGAEMLPTLKKMAELGEIEASTTKEQAQAAEKYEVALARLAQQKTTLWNVLVSALLPSMQTFVELLIDASKKTDSLGNSVKTLAADKSIENWADSSAIGVGNLVDVIKTLIKIGDETLAPFQRYFLAAQSGYAAIAIMASNASKAEKDEALYALRAQTAATNAELQQRMYKGGFAGPGFDKTTSSSVAAAIALRKAYAIEDADARAQDGGTVPGKPLNFAIGDAAKMAAELKLYQNALQALEQQRGVLNHQTQEEKTLYQLTSGSLQKLTAAHGEHLLQVAREIDVKEKALASNKAYVQGLETLYDAIDKANQAQADFNEANSVNRQDAEFQISLIGKNAVEIEKLTAIRRIDLEAQKAAAKVDTELAPDQYQAIIDNARRATDDTLKLIEQRRAAERSWATGAKSVFDDYIDHATNAAEQARMLFTDAFKGMEDALVDFVKTGKLDFKSLADSIISDLIRIQVRKAMAGAMSGGDGGIFGGVSSALGSLFGGSGAPVFAEAAGGDFMVNRPTLFLAGEAGPERATFSGANRAMSGASAPEGQVNITFHVNSLDPRTAASVIAQNADVIKGVIRKATNERGRTADF